MKSLLTAADRKCRNIVAGLVAALHVSRTADARRLLHRHRQLRDEARCELPHDTSIHQQEDTLDDAHPSDHAPCGYYSSSLAKN
jgi:hypothetical protein